MEKQLKYAKIQCIFSVVAAVVSVIVLCIVVGFGAAFLPKINTLMENADALMVDADSLVTKSESSIENAMDKLNKIDFETLNNAISELETVIKPVSNLFGAFGR